MTPPPPLPSTVPLPTAVLHRRTAPKLAVEGVGGFAVIAKSSYSASSLSLAQDGNLESWQKSESPVHCSVSQILSPHFLVEHCLVPYILLAGTFLPLSIHPRSTLSTGWTTSQGCGLTSRTRLQWGRDASDTWTPPSMRRKPSTPY